MEADLPTNSGDGIEDLLRKMDEIIEETFKDLRRLGRELKLPLAGDGEDRERPQLPVEPNVGVWELGNAWQREFQLYPEELTREELDQRLFDQVYDLLSIMQDPVRDCPWNQEDRKKIEGLNAILTIKYRLMKTINNDSQRS